MDTHCVDDGSRAPDGAKNLWCAFDEAAQQLDQQPGAVLQCLVPMSYYPEPLRDHIRFRVMGAPYRITKLWWQDVVAMKNASAFVK